MKIFCFGSNTQGVHGAGAALEARRRYGAVYGVGEGITGNAYAIPTKDHNLKPRSLNEIKASVDKFLSFACENQDLEFKVTRIGCGLAGYKDFQIAPFFQNAPPNVELPVTWEKYRK